MPALILLVKIENNPHKKYHMSKFMLMKTVVTERLASGKRTQSCI